MRACEACGAEASGRAVFCGQCGTRLGPAVQQFSEAAAPSPLPPAALRRSERKVVTVLFADIKGSLALMAELGGEILGRAVACMTEAVRRHGGLVNQIMGDGIMALFGAPIAMEDHATQACMAALAMRTAIQEQVRPHVRVRVGLGSGEVVVGTVLGDFGPHYSGAGEAVHLAARMEQTAEPDQVLLTGATRQLAGAGIRARAVERMAVKGIEGGLTVFELLGLEGGRAEARPGAGPGRLLVGRAREMDVLREARDRASTGEGQAIRLVGEAGAGKSRLLREFTRLYLPEHWQFCQADALPHRRTSYGVVCELLTGLFRLHGDDSPATRRAKVERELGAADLTPLSALLGLEADEAGWGRLEGWERRERTIATTVAALRQVSRRRAVALVVEDAHWLDPESAISLQRLGAMMEGECLLGVVTERAGPGEDAGSWSKARWREYAVGALDEDSTVAFLRSRLLPGPDVQALERKLLEHTNGNPLFLEECLEALVETGELTRVGALFRLERPVTELRVPDSLRGLLDARVDRLGDREKDVLQAAAVVGSTVPVALLREAAGVADPVLDATLSVLVQGAFLIERDTGRGEFAFRHGLIRESAYRGMLRRTRVRMHGAVLRVLEERVSRERVSQEGAGDQTADLLANHALQAEAWPKAVGYARRAATRAFERYANPEALQYFDQALMAARHLPDGTERDVVLQQLLVGVRGPLFLLGNLTALALHLDEAVRLAENAARREAAGGHEALAQAFLLRSHVHWLRGEPGRALGDAAAAWRLAERHDDAELRVSTRFQRGLVSLSKGDVAGTVADMGSVVEHMRLRADTGRYNLDVHLVVTALGYAARMHAAAGSLDRARADCDAALGLAGTLERRRTKIYAHVADSVVAMAEGDPNRAVAAAAMADRLCREADVRLMSPVAAGFLAQAHLAAGHSETALPIARQAVVDAERMGFQALQAQRRGILAAILLATNAVEEALETGRAAVQEARARDEGASEAAALAVTGDALRRLGRSTEADAAHRDEATLARRLGLVASRRTGAACAGYPAHTKAR